MFLGLLQLKMKRFGYICRNCYNNEGLVSEKTIKMIRLYYYVDIKKLQFVYSSIDANSSMVLIEAKKDCKNDVKVLKPIIKK